MCMSCQLQQLLQTSNRFIHKTMSIGIGDNFNYQGSKFNMDRDSFQTKEAMKNYPETSLPPKGFRTYCAEDDEYYEFNAGNSVDPDTGKWRMVDNPTAKKTVEDAKTNGDYAKEQGDAAKEAARKVTNDVLFKVFQSLTEEEQTQVKQNIGIGVEQKFQGQFESYSELEGVSSPAVGDYAYVGNPRNLYAYKSSGWVNLGEFNYNIDQELDASSERGIANGVVTKGIASIEEKIGFNEYPTFSEEVSYQAGNVVNYNGKLYQFTSDHAAGAWIGTDTEETNITKARIVQEFGNNEDKIVSQKAISERITPIGIIKSANVLDLEQIQVDKALSYAINGKTIEDDVIDAGKYLLSQVFECTEGQIIRVKYGNTSNPQSWAFVIRFYDNDRRSTQSLNNLRTVEEQANGVYEVPVPTGAKYFRYICPYNNLPNWHDVLMLTIDNPYPEDYIKPAEYTFDGVDIKGLSDHVNNLDESIEDLKHTLKVEVENELKFVGTGTKQYISEAIIGQQPVYGSRGWTALQELDVVEGEIYYLFCCYNNCIQCVVLDSENKVVLVKDTYIGGTLKITIPENGVKMQWVCDGSTSRGWYLKLNKDDSICLNSGTKEKLNLETINSESTDITLQEGNFIIDGNTTFSANVTASSFIQIPINGEHLRAGIWVSIPTDENGLPLIETINFSGGTKNIGSYIHNNFYFIQVVNGKSSFENLTLSFSLKEGIESVNISISSYVWYDLLNKPIYVVDFDATYESMVTEDGGIYDYLFKTLKLPATIHTADNTYYDFTDLIKSGQIDYSIYGGTIYLNDDNKPSPKDLYDNIVQVLFDIENSTGVCPQTIAFRKHFTTPAYSKICKRGGFNSSRFGWGWGSDKMSCGLVFLENDLVVSDGGFANAFIKSSYQMGVLDLFAHRLSDDGSGGATTSWSGYKESIEYILELDDSVVFMNLRQLYTSLKSAGFIIE